jgi:transglutaminase-like putative cysteine protease
VTGAAVPTRYSIRHITRFNYDVPVSESLMEVRMQPRTEGTQRCLRFELAVAPRARVFGYRDHLGNSVHHFDTPARHTQLTITARAYVELDPLPAIPASLDPRTWREVDTWAGRGDLWDFLQPSRFALWTETLREYVASISGDAEVPVGSRDATDPLTTIRALMHGIHRDFEYVPRSTRVDSPIDEALSARRGVCQDFAHIMIALVRQLGMPCRYVSGYLFQQSDREVRSSDGATHAWVEALIPGLGWIGFDPTNNILAGDHHIRVAIGRDYADVPPTRGVFKGLSAVRSELAVAVAVGTAQPALPGDVPAFVPWMSQEAMGARTHDEDSQQQ